MLAVRPGPGSIMAALSALAQANAPDAPSSFRAADGTKFKRVHDYAARPSVEAQLRMLLQKATSQQQCQELLLNIAAACPDVSSKTRTRWRKAVLDRISQIERAAREAPARPLIVVPT